MSDASGGEGPLIRRIVLGGRVEHDVLTSADGQDVGIGEDGSAGDLQLAGLFHDDMCAGRVGVDVRERVHRAREEIRSAPSGRVHGGSSLIRLHNDNDVRAERLKVVDDVVTRFAVELGERSRNLARVTFDHRVGL